MNSKIIIKIFAFIIFQISVLSAQNTLEVGLDYAFASEKLIPTTISTIDFESKTFHSVGIHGNLILKSGLYVKGGLSLKTFGTKFIVEETTILEPEGNGEYFDVSWNLTSIDIPIKFGYYFLNQDKLRIGLTMGISNCFVLDQTQNLREINTNIEHYRSFIVSAISGLEIGVKLSNNLIINISPFWTRQLNSNSIEFKQRGIGCQIGISHSFLKS